MKYKAGTLDDKYTLDDGRVYMTGIQALVRLPIMQRRRDLAAGLNTAGFVSGYRGSPVAAYDLELWNAKNILEANHIKFEPGINEDMAATALWGTQQVQLSGKGKYDGVFGIWYGKNPGLDRCGDAFKHANLAGTSPNGGVLAVAGDDHGGLSSSMPNQSDQALIASMIPILYPASVQEYLDFGLIGLGMSRFAGLWVGFKAVTEIVESAASVYVNQDGPRLVLPEDAVIPNGGLHIRWSDSRFDQEDRHVNHKLPAAVAYAKANSVDRIIFDSPQARIGIATSGKAYLDVRQALDCLGIDDQVAARIGLRLYKVGMVWPFEPEGARLFAEGLQEIVVIEEKRPIIESELRSLLYNLGGASRPRIIGKTDPAGRLLVPSHGETNPVMVARIIAGRLANFDNMPNFTSPLAEMAAQEQSAKAECSDIVRTPFFCAGCPHNTGTKTPSGSRVFGGVGCHAMAVWMPESGVKFFTHMGGEGATWIGESPFTDQKHVFQNLGDGTYYHSGLLAIRASVAAKTTITYKLLFNDAVAMTGGQPLDAGLNVPQIAQQVYHEGVKRIAIVTDEPDKYGTRPGFPAGTTIHHRDEMDAVQREFQETPGVTLLVYDQTCAAEKRRRRKRGAFPDPAKRAFINDLVCEGCGDCGVKSNCVAIAPMKTEFGRKRVIDQSVCNKDFSCVKGFCPSFVTVHGGGVRKRKGTAQDFNTLFRDLPEPSIPELTRPYEIFVGGIGGTGVLTVGALLGMAAHLEGLGCTVLDFTGLSQKNGEVLSEVRIAPRPEDLHSLRIRNGNADLLIGCDLVVASGAESLKRTRHGRTRAVVNTHLVATAEFINKPRMDLDAKRLENIIGNALGGGNTTFLNANALLTALMGDSITGNLFLLGVAYQKGLVPIMRDSLERAIELNGVAVADNLRAFSWGRLAAHDRAVVEEAAAPYLASKAQAEKVLESTDDIIAFRVKDLTSYQNAAYAARYRELVRRVQQAESQTLKGRSDLTKAVARNFHRLMAYKDEYEVARLFTDGRFQQKLDSQFEGFSTLRFYLAPPLFAKRDPNTGELVKKEFGPWIFKAMGLLAKLKFLRGRTFDLFGHTQERRTERQLIDDYETVMTGLLSRLTLDNYALAVEIASIPEEIHGFGHVKARKIPPAKKKEASLRAAFDNGGITHKVVIQKTVAEKVAA